MGDKAPLMSIGEHYSFEAKSNRNSSQKRTEKAYYSQEEVKDPPQKPYESSSREGGRAMFGSDLSTDSISN